MGLGNKFKIYRILFTLQPVHLLSDVIGKTVIIKSIEILYLTQLRSWIQCLQVVCTMFTSCVYNVYKLCVQCLQVVYCITC